MTPPRERTKLGLAIKEIRQQKGLRQQEIVDRIGHYADVSAYRRVENGSRTPDRDTAIAILRYGLQIADKARIDTCLALAGYEAISVGEAEDLKLPAPAEAAKQPTEPPTLPAAEREPALRQRFGWPVFAAIIGSLALAALLCSETEYGPFLGTLLCSLYAALYVVSLLLESAYEPAARRVSRTVSIFSLMLMSSAAACVADARLVRAGAGFGGLIASLGIDVFAVVFQAVLSKPILPSYPIVKARIQTHTGQAAHLKNTGYFFVIVLLFWLPPLHAVAVLREQLRLGHAGLVTAAIGHWILLGHGIIAFNYGWLFVALFALAILAIAMRAQIVDNLRPHPSQNAYLLLFYIRAAIYFTLSGICVAWYAYAMASLSG